MRLTCTGVIGSGGKGGGCLEISVALKSMPRPQFSAHSARVDVVPCHSSYNDIYVKLSGIHQAGGQSTIGSCSVLREEEQIRRPLLLIPLTSSENSG